MIELSDTSDLEAQYRRSLEPPPDLPWWQWASAGGVMLLPPVPTPRYGPYDIEWTPHLVGIAMALSDPNVWCVTVQKPAQEGCTTFAVVYFLWKARFDPGNILYVTANVDLARDKAEETFKPMIEGSPEIAAELVDDRHNLNALRFQFKKCTWYNAGGNSAKGLASKPVPYIILDEENKYDQDTEEGDQSELAIERTNTFHNRKVIRPCTPRTKKSRGYRAFMQGDQRRFFVPCPHCGHRQRLEHKQVTWPADVQPMKAAEEARYKCASESCGVLWTDQDRVAAIHAARHLPDFGWIPTAEPMEKGITSFQFSKLANPHVTLSAYVSKWLRSQQSKELLRGFIQNWMGECWESEAIEVTPAALAACRAGYSLANPTPERVSEIAEWTHREGKEVESQVFIHADVQKDGMWWLVRRFWRNGGDSALIGYGFLSGPNQYKQYDDLCTKYDAAFASIDMGDGNRQAEILEACRQFGFTPMKGSSRESNMPLLFRESAVNEITGRHGGEQSTQFLEIATGRVKELLYENYVGKGKERFWIPADTPEEYCVQVTSEKFNHDTELWELRDGLKDNHLLDCEVNLYAAATHQGYMVKVSE